MHACLVKVEGVYLQCVYWIDCTEQVEFALLGIHAVRVAWPQKVQLHYAYKLYGWKLS